jgi:uncharacterized protein (TIGR00730 family)
MVTDGIMREHSWQRVGINSSPNFDRSHVGRIKDAVQAIHRVCVFCGSSAGTHPVYRQAAVDFGTLLARQTLELVYGAGSVGLMGAIADAALAAGGHVIGVIPHFLATRELLHEGLTEIIETHDMHERKAKMSSLSDAFVALPGGLGTFEELFEVLTWAQLGLHAKPIGLLNVRGYFDPLIELVDRAIGEGFCRPEHRRLFVVDTESESLLQQLRDHDPPKLRKWIESVDET